MVIQVAATLIALTGASATGALTVASGKAAPVYPGSLAWVYKDDGSASARVKIVAVAADIITVRRFKNDDENAVPQYGRSDMSAFATGSHISIEAQLAPANRAGDKIASVA